MLTRFRRDEKAVTAVEFALVAFPFFVFIFAVVEIGISFAAQQILSSATEDLSRKFYTGQLTVENTSAAQVRTMICDRIRIIVHSDCKNLFIELNHYNSFSEVPVTGLVARTMSYGSSGSINLGGTATINQLNVLYRWPAITNIMSLVHSNDSSGDNIVPLFTTITWQNEPF